MGEAGAVGEKRGRGKGLMLPGLKEARLDAGLSQEDLEQETSKLGKRVYQPTIAALENLQRGAQHRNARVLAQALGTTVRELRRG